MAWEEKDGFGALFKTDQKGNEKAPGYKGTLMLGGVVYEIAGWVREGKSGKFFSLSGKVKGEKREYVAKPKPAEDSIFDDAPF